MGFRPQSSGLAFLAALLAAACSASLSCSTTRMDFRHLPTPDALASIRSGVTTRTEVLRRLGPPEEMRRPANFDRARPITPQYRRVIEAGRIFADDAYTYASARRQETSFSLIPGGPSLLSISSTRFLEQRWRIEFDARGVVQSVSQVDELEETK